MGLTVRVLGPLEVVVNGTDVTPRAPKERALVALLGLRRCHVVPADALMEELWPGLSPERAKHTLHVRLAAIRKALRSAGGTGLEYRNGGYVLDLGPDDIDQEQFRNQVDVASRHMAGDDPEAAASCLRAALAMWRGEPLADSRGTVTLDAEAARLADARLGALEDRIDADLACGRHQAVVSELDGLVALHPLRERLWAQRVVALYRCGRQAHALRACAEVRNLLGDELGLAPGPVLRMTEAAVLAHSPDLDWPGLRPGEGARPVSTVSPADWRPPVRYARTRDGLNIAYQVAGDGPVDLIVIPGFTSHLDVWWDAWSGQFARRLAHFARIIVFDKRGCGLSDRPPHSVAEDWVEDARSVLDAAGSARAVVLGMSGGGTVGVLFAVTHPERTRSLILYGASARYLQSDDYPMGTPLDVIERSCAMVEANWGTGVMFGALCPSAKRNPTLRADYARLQRLSASPGAAAAYLWDLNQMDVRDALPLVTAPTLVMHARGDRTDPVERARYMAERIPGARMVELDSEDHLIWLTSALGRLIDEIRAFVEQPTPDRPPPVSH